MVAAGVLGLAAGGWPVVRAQAGESGPSTRSQLASALADRTFPAPEPGSWTPPKPAPDGLPPIITDIATKERVVFLTIDDGYVYDAEFVNLVRKEKVPIMTFLTTRYVEGHGQYFWAMKRAGSPMENHTIGHPDMATLSPAAQKKEICESSDVIEKQYGRRPTLFRPPFGSYNETTRRVAKDCGVKALVMWSAEYYNGTSGPGVGFNGFARGDGGQGFKPGDIILMHFRKGLAGQLEAFLDKIRKAGFRPAALENYLPESLGGNAPDRDGA
ncbi:polysaccharide deacetylase family protein [Actinomadura sp. WMMB 499]|uniref:polysaccharide deacetylase family protein n=1 Tax=Actinomadura sp. WMMB 499 TaxID=1219491 RepID=UPI0020C76A51|nr:polysaccharide deacetylase family protein [Actinomadura sp. WMMB 499]